MTVDYKAAGVDIAAGNEAVRRIKKNVERTFSESVMTGIGSFASLYDLAKINKEYKHPVLVQSIDGVGTKIMLARMLNRYDTIGRDLVAATTNDIIVLGAKPLTLLDYIANDTLDPATVEQIVAGMVAACRENEISLVGGETAEMPGTYLPGEHDLVGVITGVVEKNAIINGSQIVPGDKVLAFASSGLHTNGYSLARKLFFDIGQYDVHAQLAGLEKPLGETLLTPHLNYTQPVHALLKNKVAIKGMAHITGGGLLENIPRVLPAGCAVSIHKNTWPQQAVFNHLCQLGQLADDDMYRTFNMGVGLVLIMSAEAVKIAHAAMREWHEFPLYEIGEVVESVKGVERVRLGPAHK